MGEHMQIRRIAQLALALLLIAPAQAPACLWDTDTLAMERQRFPEALELIVGKFLRHSREYYHWRISDRLAKIQDDPDNPALYDDLAVAYDKTGQTQKAIDLMLEIEPQFPRRYQTYANLGTFYIHAGDFESGLEHIEQALQINPNAHFGREEYQKLLVEYLLAKRSGQWQPPSQDFSLLYEPQGFAGYLAHQKGLSVGGGDWESEQKRAVKGILGMMRFGNYQSPQLQAALGDLLLLGDDDAKLLAARAYLQAARHSDEQASRDRYRELARTAISNQYEARLAVIEAELNEEVRAANAWFEQIQQDEIRWINQGVDVDAAFAAKYYRPPRVHANDFTTLAQTVIAFGIGLAVLAALFGGWWLLRRRRIQNALASQA